MALESTITAETHLVDFNADHILVYSWELAAVPHDATDHQVTSVQSLHPATQKQTWYSRWNVWTAFRFTCNPIFYI